MSLPCEGKAVPALTKKLLEEGAVLHHDRPEPQVMIADVGCYGKRFGRLDSPATESTYTDLDTVWGRLSTNGSEGSSEDMDMEEKPEEQSSLWSEFGAVAEKPIDSKAEEPLEQKAEQSLESEGDSVGTICKDAIAVQRDFVKLFRDELSYNRSLLLSQLNNLCKMRGHPPFDFQRCGFKRLNQFVASIPGLAVWGRGGRMRAHVVDLEKLEAFCASSEHAEEPSGEAFIATSRMVDEVIIQKIQGFIASFPNGISPGTFLPKWQQTFGEIFPFREYGHRDIKGLLASVPGVFRSGSGEDQAYRLKLNLMARILSDFDATRTGDSSTQKDVARETTRASRKLCGGLFSSAPCAVSNEERDVMAGGLGKFGILNIVQTWLHRGSPCLVFNLSTLRVVAMNSLCDDLLGSSQDTIRNCDVGSILSCHDDPCALETCIKHLLLNKDVMGPLAVGLIGPSGILRQQVELTRITSRWCMVTFLSQVPSAPLRGAA